MKSALFREPVLKQESLPWHTLIAIWFGTVFDGFDASIFTIVLFPAMSELLGTTSHSMAGVYGSVVVATLLIGYFVGGTCFGMLADKIGRTKTMTLTILLYASFTGLCAISHNWIELAIYRFLVGCGIGGEICVSGVLLSESLKNKNRLHAMGFFLSAFPVGAILAALLNLWIGNLGWRWLFIAGIVPALLTIYIRSKIKEPKVFTLTRELKKVAKSNSTHSSSLRNIGLLEVFSPKYRTRAFLAACLSTTAIVGYWAVLSWIPPWINQLTGTKAVDERSWAFFIMNVGGIIGAVCAGTLVSYLDRKKSFLLVFTGGLISSLGMFLTVKSFGAALLAWTFAVGLFANLPFALLLIYLPEIFDTHLRGAAVGFTYNTGRILGAAAVLTSGQLIALFGGSYAAAGACCASLYIIGIIASLFIKPISNTLDDPIPEIYL